ncbi:hypothetical protein [Moheibacter lacus]|uniref:Uncharacterized protein n=1 Tax=Moheibacter lacus TaxID=2745851 RepID=A0A838ZHS3_9FLAO|nr:hypothetical protein [Moheibacter lacus]MBA5629221.1 hypothetical protein [Moheibacter lacus]
MGVGNFDLIFYALILVLIALAVCYKFFAYVIRSYFLNESTWFVQQTILSSYFVFKYLTSAIIISYLIIGVYFSVFTLYWYYGLILLGLTSYLIYRILKDIRDGKFNLRDDFEFNKYSTAVSFYNNQSEQYRKKSFQAVIDKIKRTEINGLGKEDYAEFLNRNVLSKIENVLTFEYYDSKLNHSISDHYTGNLFYRKFLKNLKEVLSRIDKRTNDLKLLNSDYQVIVNLLLNIKLLNFDDIQGYHYKIDLLDEELDVVLKERNDYSLEQYKDLLKFNGDSKKIYSLFEKYLEFKYNNSNHLKELKIQFISFVNFFGDGKYYEPPYIKSFETKDIKHLIGFFSYLSGKGLVKYNVQDLVFLVLKITGHEEEVNNTSFEQAHRNIKFKLSEIEEKALNARYNKLFNSLK